jgi:UDP-N-acetylmuramate dehydrogenase
VEPRLGQAFSGAWYSLPPPDARNPFAPPRAPPESPAAVPVTLLDELAGRPGVRRVERGASLAPLTTLGVGGRADWLIEAGEAGAVAAAVSAIRREGLRLTVLGGGSNVLVSDAGVRGAVLLVRGGGCRGIGGGGVGADAGVTINGLVRWCILRGLAGLESWAGTPGSVGGAIYGNAHFRGQLIGERVREALLLSPKGETLRATRDELGFGYDVSRLQTTGEILLGAVFEVGEGAPEHLRRQARESLLFRKRTQPLALRSAGCIFQNPDPDRDRVPKHLPASAGALIDAAGLKGCSRGGARVSARHANFIVNEGGATAADVASLAELCRRTVRERFGVELREEIVRLGEF